MASSLWLVMLRMDFLIDPSAYPWLIRVATLHPWLPISVESALSGMFLFLAVYYLWTGLNIGQATTSVSLVLLQVVRFVAMFVSPQFVVASRKASESLGFLRRHSIFDSSSGFLARLLLGLLLYSFGAVILTIGRRAYVSLELARERRNPDGVEPLVFYVMAYFFGSLDWADDVIEGITDLYEPLSRFDAAAARRRSLRYMVRLLPILFYGRISGMTSSGIRARR